MNYRTPYIFVVLMLQPFYAWAQESSFTAEFGYGSKLADRGLQLGDSSFNPSIEYGQGDFYAGVWAALPLENKGWPEYFVEEYDIYAGYGWALDEKTSLDVGATRYYYPDAADSLEGYVGLTREMGTFSPSIYVYNDFDLDAWTIELSTNVALPLEIVPFETRFFIGYVEAKGAGDYSYYGADFVYPIELSDSTKLSLGLHYSDNDVGFGVADDHLYGTASIAVTF